MSFLSSPPKNENFIWNPQFLFQMLTQLIKDNNSDEKTKEKVPFFFKKALSRLSMDRVQLSQDYRATTRNILLFTNKSPQVFLVFV